MTATMPAAVPTVSKPGRSANKAKTGTNILAQNRDPERLMDIFRDDVRKGRLPQVSWMVAP